MLSLSLYTDEPWEDTWKLVLIVVGGVAFVIAVVLIIRCFLRNDNQNNDPDQETQRLVGDGDALRNDFSDLGDGARSANLQNASPSLCSDITEHKKDDVKVSNGTILIRSLGVFFRSYFNVILSANQRA